MEAHNPTAVRGGESDRRYVSRVDDFGADLYGPFNLATGLGASSRGYARALVRAGVPVHLRAVDPLFTGLATVEVELESDPRRFPLTVEHVNADTTERFLSGHREELTAARARVAVWYWELAAFRPDWLPSLRYYDEIWVASQFGQRAVSAVTNLPVAVVPPPVVASATGDGRARERHGIPAEAFVFLYVFDYSSYVDRKNPACLVDAFVDAFCGEPDVRLVLKLSHVDEGAPGFRSLCAAAESNVNITLISDVLDEADLLSLFDAADCYVSPHRSEGFGLTIAEAMLRGCPVIATDYGATTDFVTSETGFPLDYTLVEIPRDQGPYQRGYVWADPSREHLRHLLGEVAGDAPETRRRAKAGRRFVEEHYSLGAAGERMRLRLRALYDGLTDA